MFEIGNSLLEARSRRGVDFVQAELATKIRAKYLRALEEERFEQLPSQTYVKGFLRTYADYLGLDGQLYVDEYNSRFVAGDEMDFRPRRSAVRPERRTRRLETAIVLVAVAVVAIVTLVLVGAWQTSGSGAKAPAAAAADARRQEARELEALCLPPDQRREGPVVRRSYTVAGRAASCSSRGRSARAASSRSVAATSG